MKRIAIMLTIAVIAIILVFASCAPKEEAPPAPPPAPPPPPVIEPMTLLADWDGLPGPFGVDGMTVLFFEEQVTEMTNGKVTFENFWASSFHSLAEILDGLSAGTVDLGVFCWGFYPTKLYLHNLLISVPFSLTDIWKTKEIADSLQAEGTILAAELEKLNVKWLFNEITPSYEILTAKKPISRLEDFQGMKIGLTGAMPSRLLEAAGATPVPIDLLDRPTALQTGLLDGSMLSTMLHNGIGTDEFAKYVATIDWGAWTTCAYAINLELFNSFPKELQDIFVEAGRAAQTFYIETRLEERGKVKAAREAAGIIYSPPLPFEDKVRWTALAGEPLVEWVKGGEEKGLPARELAEKFLRMMEEAGHEFPKEWALD